MKLHAGGIKSRLDGIELLERNVPVDLEGLRATCRQFGLGESLESFNWYTTCRIGLVGVRETREDAVSQWAKLKSRFSLSRIVGLGILLLLLVVLCDQSGPTKTEAETAIRRYLEKDGTRVTAIRGLLVGCRESDQSDDTLKLFSVRASVSSIPGSRPGGRASEITSTTVFVLATPMYGGDSVYSARSVRKVP